MRFHEAWIPGLLIIIGCIMWASYLLFFHESPPPNPLRYIVPQTIVGSHVLHRGEEFKVFRSKCNDGDEPLAVLGKSDWRQIDTSGSFLSAIPHRSSNVPLIIPAHECNVREGTNQIPDDLPFGTWQLEGQDCVTPGLVICAVWWTERFEVVP